MNFKINSTRKENIHRFEIIVDDLTLPNNEPACYSYIQFGKAVCILPITQDNKVICLRQYRYPIKEWQWELPAGLVDAEDQDVLEAAKRELEEETGYQADTWIPMKSFYPSSGAMTEHTYLFAAMNLRKKDQRLEKTELIEVHEIEINDLYTLIRTGQFKQGAGMAAILQYILSLKQD